MHLLLFSCLTVTIINSIDGGIIIGTKPPSYNDGDDYEKVYRIYSGDDWNSHDDYLSQERTAKNGDEDDSQFRSWKVDQWDDYNVKRVKVEIFDHSDKVAEFEFDGDRANSTSFWNSRSLIRSSYDDIPDGPSNVRFPGDDFSFDGDDDSRHWTVSSRQTRDCRQNEGWFQVIDKPKPHRARCVCAYENVDKYPAIMYSKGRRKAKWDDDRNVGYADMMQISVSHKPYRTAAPPRQQPKPVYPQQPKQPQQVYPQQPQQVYPQQPQQPPQGFWVAGET